MHFFFILITQYLVIKYVLNSCLINTIVTSTTKRLWFGLSLFWVVCVQCHIHVTWPIITKLDQSISYPLKLNWFNFRMSANAQGHRKGESHSFGNKFGCVYHRDSIWHVLSTMKSFTLYNYEKFGHSSYFNRI